MVVNVNDFIGEEPQMGFEWMPVIGSFPSWGPNAQLKEYDVQEVSIPFLSFEQQSIYLEGVRQAFAGSADALSFSMAIHLFKNPRGLRWLLGWMYTIRSPEGFYGLPINYQRNLKFQLVDPMGNPTMTATMINAWPFSPNQLDLNKAISDPIMLNLQFSAKNVHYDFTTP